MSFDGAATSALSPDAVHELEFANGVTEQAAVIKEKIADIYNGPTLVRYQSDNMGNSNNDLDSAYQPALTDEEFFLANKSNILQFCIGKFPDCTPDRIRIGYMKGGSYNRVIALNILLPSPPKCTDDWVAAWLPNPRGMQKEEAWKRLIIRIPRFSLLGYGIGYDIAVLQFARSRLSGPVARLLSFDLSADNALNNPYTIQERLRGHNLDEIITTLNLGQLKCLVRQLVSSLEEMRGITSTSAGVLRPRDKDTSATIHLDKFMVPPRRKIEYHDFPKPPNSPMTPQTTLELLVEQCNRFKEHEIETDGWAMPVWEDFLKIACSMHAHGFIPDTELFYLCHMDLMARNILVEIVDDSTVNISGLLDWDADYACFCPKFVAFRAPFWLWLPDGANDNDETVASIEPVDLKHRELKSLFEELADKEWKRYSYEPEFVLARRMFKCLKNGLFSNAMYEEAEEIIEQWNLLHPTQGLSMNAELEHQMEVPLL